MDPTVVFLAFICFAILCETTGSFNETSKKDFIDAAGKYVSSVGYATDAVGQGLKVMNAVTSIANIAGALGAVAPALQAVAVMFSLVAAISGMSEDSEVKAGFKEMQKQFDQLNQKIDAMSGRMEQILDEIKAHQEFVALADGLKKQRAFLTTLYSLYQRTLDTPNNHSRIAFSESCHHGSDSSPLKILDWFTQYATDDKIKLLLVSPTIMTALKYDLREYTQWCAVIVADVMVASITYHACLGVTGAGKEGPSYLEKITEETSQKLNKIKFKLIESENILKKGFKVQAKKEITAVLKQHETSKAYKIIRQQLHTDLSKKYFWLHWGVLVSDGQCGYSSKHRNNLIIIAAHGMTVHAMFVKEDCGNQNPIEQIKKRFEKIKKDCSPTDVEFTYEEDFYKKNWPPEEINSWRAQVFTESHCGDFLGSAACFLSVEDACKDTYAVFALSGPE